MSEHDLVAEWLEIAYDDYDSAKFLFDNKRPNPLEIICFHCQQSVDKSLKAFLCFNDIKVPKTHATRVLCAQCADINNDFSDYLAPCAELQVYATDTRYPLRIEIDEAKAGIALWQALEIYNFVAGLIRPALNV
ncbi:MAG: HEPN domain-containing protein [Oscillospiraceae bacterium]|nr:HEPN domain-containing protein [Oscillospiraceae bacterium]